MAVPVSPSEILERLLAGDRAALARAITLVESSRPEHQEQARELVESCLPQTGRAARVGVTGVPGAGKSTFIEGLGLQIIRERGENLAVLAIDPSSPLTGGSILGDKTRMPRLSAEPKAFIRPSPSGGTAGGVGAKTREAILLCEAAGFENILIETMGVGQSEIAAASMVDFLVLLALAGAGDELQGIKRGVLELADLVAVNKADGGNRAPAETARRQLEASLSLFPSQADGWRPPVVVCSARTGAGVADIWGAIVERRRQMIVSGELRRKRGRQAQEAMYAEVRRALADAFFARPDIAALLPRLEEEVREGRKSVNAAAGDLLHLGASDPLQR